MKGEMMKIIKNIIDWNIVPRGLLYMFFGPPKTHKTTEASRWSEKGTDGVLLADCEQGGDFVQGANRVVITSLNPPERPKMKDGKQLIDKMGMPIFEIIPPEERGYVYSTGKHIGQPMPVYSIAEFVMNVKAMLEKGEFPYDAIVLDTIDEINDWAEKEVCKQLNIKAMGEGEWGNDWAMARDKVFNIVSMLKMLLRKYNKDLILISHSKTTVIVKNKAQLGPDLPRGLSKKLMGLAELIGYTSKKEKTGQAFMSFKGFDEIQMGARLKPLADQEIPFDYQSFVKTITSYTE
jgi:hypothetical protein